MTTMVRMDVAERLASMFATALAAETTVRVLDHVPTGAEQDLIPREFVCLGDIEGTTALVAYRGGSGVTPFEDDYTIDVIAGVYAPGLGALAARARCGVIMQTAIDAIRADPGLTDPTGITGHCSLELGELTGPQLIELPERTGYAVEAVLTLRCVARLSE